MNTTVKIGSIIKALENVDPASLHGLCDDLVYAGALIPELKGKSILPKGWNPAKHHTIRSPEDSTIELEEGLCVLEYSRAENWVKKLKADVASIKQWAETESKNLVRFIFITTRDIGNQKIESEDEKKLTPEEFIEKEFSQFNIKASVFGQKELLVPLQNSDYSYIRRKWLHISEDYFQSLESFESRHIKQTQDRHIYLQAFVPGSDREESVNALETFAGKMDKRVLLIHAQGGIGKTRFALESLKRVKEQNKNIDILFNQRREDVNVNEVIPEISEERESFIVLDDAHLIDNLTDFAKILLEREGAKIILITRSTAKDSVKGAIGDYPVKEIELSPLDRDSSIELLKGNLEEPPRDKYLKYVADICEGNPLLIGLTAYLINGNKIQSFDALKTDNLVRDYFATILNELKNRVAPDCYQPYLALLFLLKPFSINDAETRSLIRNLVHINKVQEGLLLRDLEQCAVLERHGDTLWLYPDLLGEYLVETTFFSDIPILNFDDIFPQMPPSNLKSVFKTLRELDSNKAELFLRKWANDLLNTAESQNCYELCDNLELLEIIIVPEVTDTALQIIEFLLKPDNEKPSAKSEHLWLSTRTVEYPHILQQCLRILENLRYLNFNEVLEKVLKIYFYKPESEKYSGLHKKALETITKTVAYNLDLWEHGWGYSIQTKMFGKVREWKQENLEKNFTLILRVCEKLLETEIKSEYWDYEGFGWSLRAVEITDDLICLRRGVISLLQLIFDETQGSQQQSEVVQVLNYATEYPLQTQYGERMKEMIQDNTKTVLDFYRKLVTRTPPPELEALQGIEQQVHRLKAWYAEDIEGINQILYGLQSNEWYQLYRTLVGSDSLVWRNEGKSYEQAKNERDEKIRRIADTITDENLSEWLENLNRISETASGKFHQDFLPFCQLLFKISKNKPHIGQALIDNSLLENSALKKFIAELIRGFRESTRSDIAGNYVNGWLSGEDRTLVLEIPETYRDIDEKFLGVKDVEIFDTLLNCEMKDKEHRQRLDRHMMSNIGWVYKKNPAKATEIICELFKRADQENITHYLHELWWASKIQVQIDLSQWDLEIFKTILQKFVDIPVLSENASHILAQYGQKDPLELVRFFERRVEKQMGRDDFFRYTLVPGNLNEIAEMYQAHPRYSEVINQIMEWFQKDDFHYKQAAANLISGISPQLDGPLKQTLLNLIRSGDEQKIRTVSEILEKFPENSAFDNLCKEAIKHSKGERELQKSIENMIVHRSRSWWGIDGGVKTFQNLKEKLSSWLEDENQYVHDFAQRVIERLEYRIEYEEQRAAEEEIKMKKGLR